MDGYHTDMIARTGAPDMTSFFFFPFLSTLPPFFFLARGVGLLPMQKFLLVLQPFIIP